ncbi:hypothetical protein BJV82DRAFT_675424 [Fennellomyces sp. T-0311]|nr:hypothetical protein BJV82DRAFT_675424 [Fennellomyces sp. T-0311]
MYAGHFALTTVLQRSYPSFSPYVFSFGVVFPDIVHGIVAYFGLEGIVKNPNGGLMGVDIYCDYTHSLLGVLLLSSIYGAGFGFPGFIASLSHFFLDWLVHNADIVLDPFSKHVIGGTGLYGTYPEFTFFVEGLLCVACTAYAAKDRRTLLVNALILLLHVQFRFATPLLIEQVWEMDPIQRQHLAGVMLTLSFTGPGWLFGYMLEDGKTKTE